jgi:hypothetical protein
MEVSEMPTINPWLFSTLSQGTELFVPPGRIPSLIILPSIHAAASVVFAGEAAKPIAQPRSLIAFAPLAVPPSGLGRVNT